MTIAFVQSGSTLQVVQAASGTVSITGVTAGNCLVMLVDWWDFSTTGPITTPTGWTSLISATGSGVASVTGLIGSAIFVLPNASAGTTSATLTLLSTSSNGTATIVEFSGMGTSPTSNVTALDNNGSNSTSGSVGPTGTTTVAATLSLTTLSEEDNGTANQGFNTPTGYTNVFTNNSTGGGTALGAQQSYKILSATGTENPSWTWSANPASSVVWDATIAILAPSAAAAPPSSPPRLYSPMRPLTASGGVLINTPLAYILPASSNSLSFALASVTGTGSAGNVSAFVSSAVPPPLPPRLGSSTGLGGLLPQVFLQNPPPQFTNVTVTLTGVTGTGSAGSVAAFVSSAVPPLLPPSLGPATGLGGVMPTIKLAYVQPTTVVSANVTVTLTGVTGTGSVGTIGVAIASTVPPMLPPSLGPATGQGGILPTLKLAYVQPEFTNLYVTLAGVTGTASVGTITVAVDMPLPSATGTGSAGTVTAAISTALVGAAGTGSTGLVAASISTGISGVSASSSVGTISPAIAAFLTAVTGAGSVGTITSSGGTPVNNPYHSVAFFSSVAGYNSVSFFQSVAQFNSEAQP